MSLTGNIVNDYYNIIQSGGYYNVAQDETYYNVNKVDAYYNVSRAESYYNITFTDHEGWILETSDWNDGGLWIDNKNWLD
jgi:hypothetical protein